MSVDAASLAHKVHEWVTQELRLAPPTGQRMPSPEDIRKILRGNHTASLLCCIHSCGPVFFTLATRST